MPDKNRVFAFILLCRFTHFYFTDILFYVPADAATLLLTVTSSIITSTSN